MRFAGRLWIIRDKLDRQTDTLPQSGVKKLWLDDNPAPTDESRNDIGGSYANVSNVSNEPVQPIVMLPRCLMNSARSAAVAS